MKGPSFYDITQALEAIQESEIEILHLRRANEKMREALINARELLRAQDTDGIDMVLWTVQQQIEEALK